MGSRRSRPISGEYIIQLRHELPSHIIAPAFHLNMEDWEEAFRKAHTDLPADRTFKERRDVLIEARTKLRSSVFGGGCGDHRGEFSDRGDGQQRYRYQ